MDRNIGQEILQGISEINNGLGRKFTVNLPDEISVIRNELSLSQSKFASLLGVSVRTLQGWEQGKKVPNGSACSLLRIAKKHPEVFLDI